MTPNTSEIYGEEYFERGTISNYDGYGHAHFWDELAEYLSDAFKPEKVLDVGCAKGFLVYAFRRRGCQAWGVDVSSYALGEAPKEAKPYLRKVDLNNDHIPFNENHFDLLVCLETIEHIKNLDHTVREFKRVLRPEGRIYIITPFTQRTDDRDITHVNVHEKEFWLELFNEHGFQVTEPPTLPLDNLTKNSGIMTFEA